MISRKIMMSAGAGEPAWINIFTSYAYVTDGSGNSIPFYYGPYGVGVTASTEKGCYFVVGSYSNSATYYVYLNSTGSIVWQRQVRDAGFGFLTSKVSSDMYAAVGSGGGGYGVLNASGNFVSSIYITAPYGSSYYAPVFDSNMNVYTIGNYKNKLGGSNIPFIGKINSNGTYGWSTASNNPISIAVDSSNSPYYLNIGSDGSVGQIEKRNTSGNGVWGRTITSGSLNPGFVSAFGTNIYVVTNNGAAQILKFDSSGNVIWQRAGFGYPNGVTVDSTGNLYVLSGNTIYKLNDSGVVQWVRTLTHTPSFSVKFTGISILGEMMYLSGYIQRFSTWSDGNYAICMKVPTSGNLTGTYGNFVYASSTVSDTVGTASFTNYTPTFSQVATIQGVATLTGTTAVPSGGTPSITKLN